jgi:hypothetical protein
MRHALHKQPNHDSMVIEKPQKSKPVVVVRRRQREQLLLPKANTQAYTHPVPGS